jgi:L-lysine exporter family protein LysE/ArgO
MFFEGFILALSLTMSIGPQNTFLLKQGIQRQRLFVTALATVLFNSASTFAGVLGLGRFLSNHLIIQHILMAVGILFLGFLAIKAFILVFKNQHVALNHQNQTSLKKLWMQCLLLSWANPIALVENLVIFGSISSQYSLQNALLFGLGCIVAGGIWVFSLTYGASLLSPYAKSPKTWKIVNALTGVVCSYAVYTLVHRLIQGN